MSVGDVNSAAKGSGARFNDGKTPYELVPYSVLSVISNDPLVARVFNKLHDFQFSHDIQAVISAIKMLEGYVPDSARVFDYGRKKYAEWNWLKGMNWSVPLACAARHLVAIDSGENLDPESGLPHWGHVVCNLIMLHTYCYTYPEGNDLPKVPNNETE